METFKDHATALIADVDCTTEGKPLCEEHGVKGYPTIKYGDPAALEDYKGARSFAALKKFAEENLGPQCSAKNLDLCEADVKTMIEGFIAMSEEDLQKQVDEKTAELEAVDTKTQDLLKSLQSQYKEGQEEADKTKADIENSGLNLMKAVLTHRKNEKEIAPFKEMPLEELKAKIEAQEKELAQSDEDLEELVKGLQNRYEEGQKKVEEAKKKVKEDGLDLMKAVMAFRKSEEKTE